uniref:F-box domain-containing protein n=1 Tax=Anopheles albimanus TaxID=7167 RepID=A0A182FKG4_ANOAL
MGESEEPKLQLSDLPDELLVMIFDKLDVLGLKEASMVCSRWAGLAFSGRRMDRVLLKVDYTLHEPADYDKTFLESTRKYRHLQYAYNTEEMGLSFFLNLLKKFKTSIQTLKIWPNFFITLYQLQQILLELPDLQHLSVQSRICYDFEMRNDPQEPFPVRSKLQSLLLDTEIGLQCDGFDIRVVAPNLTCLDMDCDSQQALDVYKHFSHQLTSVGVFFKTDDFFLGFCELAFPLLEILDFYCDEQQMFDPTAVRIICGFFRNLTKLRRLTLRSNVSKEVVQSIASHCPELVYLSLKTDLLEENSLQSIGQLSNLQTLSLDGWMSDNIFHGCQPIPALGSVRLDCTKLSDPLVLYCHLGNVAPRLWDLVIIEADIDDGILQFITDEGLKNVSHLPILRDLQLGYMNISGESLTSFLSSTIHYISMLRCDRQLDVTSCHRVSEDGIARLRAVMPSCCIEDRLLTE